MKSLEELVEDAARGRHQAIPWLTAPAFFFAGLSDAARPGPLLVRVGRSAKSTRGAPLSVGIARSCDVVLPVEVSADVHARLWCEKEQWRLESLDARGSLRVGGKALSPHTPEPLADGTAVSFGDVEATFRTPDALWALVNERLVARGLRGGGAADRRRAGRLDVEIPCALVPDGPPVMGKAVDLSMTGVCVHTPEPVGPVGEPVLVSLGAAGPDVVLEGVVARSERRDGRAETAVRFLEMPPATSEALARLLRLAARNRERPPRVRARFAVLCRSVAQVDAMVESLSSGGVELSASRPLRAGERVAIEFRAGDRVLRLSGVVAANRSTPGATVRCAVKLDPLDEAHGQEVDGLVDWALSVRDLPER